MEIFSPRKGASQNIALAALSSALCGLCSLAISFYPLSSVVLSLIIAALASISGKLMEKKYLPIYLVAGVALILGFGAYDLANVLFFSLPSFVAGLIFSLVDKEKISAIYSIFFVSITELGLLYIANEVCKPLYGLDMMEVLASLLRIEKRDIVPSLLLSYAYGKGALNYLISYAYSSKLGIERKKHNVPKWGGIPCLIFASLSIGIGTIDETLGFLLFGLGIYWALACLAHQISQRSKWIYISWTTILVICLFLFAYFYSSYPNGRGIMLSNLFPLAVSLLEIPTLLLEQRKART